MNAASLLFTVLMVTATTALSTDPEVKAALRKSEDKVSVVSTNGTTIIAITSVSGIGGAKLISSGGEWPSNIVIRLSVKTLESFEIKTPRQSFSGSLGHSGVPTITKTNNYIQITVPHNLLEEKPEHLEFSWIDAFR